MSRLPALISSLFIRVEGKAPVRAMEGYLRAVGRHSAPWPSVACPLDCESTMPATHSGHPVVERPRVH